MTLHIRSTVTGPVVLGPNSKHLTLISSSGTVSSTGVGVDGIDGPATNPWPIENDGTVTSLGGFGISLAAGGAVSNGAGALISGDVAGIVIGGATGMVTNAGSIIGTATAPGIAVGNIVISGDGIALLAGGSVTNADGGLISGLGPRGQGDSSGSGIFITAGAGSVANAGTIGAVGYGIALDDGGAVTNSSLISGGEDGVKIAGAVGAVANAGSIVAAVDDGVALFNGGNVSNAAGASISSGPGTSAAGIFITSGAGTVANSGAVTGNKFGVLLASGSVVNGADATIVGTTAGVSVSTGPGTIVNAGGITAGGANDAGIDLQAGGSVVNAAGASITGTGFGVFIGSGAGTVENAGTISGGTYAVRFSGGGANRLIVDPGAVFIGSVSGAGSGATNTLELTAGSGSIGSVGTGSFNNFQTLAIDGGAAWTLTGPNAVPTVLDDGAIEIAGSLDVSTAIDPSSTGRFLLDSGATLEVAAALGMNTEMSFLGASELAIDDVGSFGTNVGNSLTYAGPLLDSFAVGDVIDLKNFGSVGVDLDPLTPQGVLQVSNGSEQVADLAFRTATLGAGSFQATPDGGTGVLVTLHA